MTSASNVLPLHLIPPTLLDVEILTVICSPVIALPGTCTASRILVFFPQLSSSPPESKNLEPKECEPAMTEDMYSLLLPKSVFTTSMVMCASYPDVSPEITTSQEGADDEVLEHSIGAEADVSEYKIPSINKTPYLHKEKKINQVLSQHAFIDK